MLTARGEVWKNVGNVVPKETQHVLQFYSWSSTPTDTSGWGEEEETIYRKTEAGSSLLQLSERETQCKPYQNIVGLSECWLSLLPSWGAGCWGHWQGYTLWVSSRRWSLCWCWHRVARGWWPILHYTLLIEGQSSLQEIVQWQYLHYFLKGHDFEPSTIMVRPQRVGQQRKYNITDCWTYI